MGFDPDVIFRGYPDKVKIIQQHECSAEKDADVPPCQTVIKTDDPFRVLQDELAKADAGTCTCISDNNDSASRDAEPHYRYVGGAVGRVNYDAIRIIEDIPDSNGADPCVMEFGIYNDGILYDHIHKKPYYFYRKRNRLDEISAGLHAGQQGDIKDKQQFGEFHAGNITSDTDMEQFSDMVNKSKKHIYDGDIFQAVLSRRFEFETSGDPLALYAKLRSLNPSPYMYHLKFGDTITIGASPEMLVRVTDDMVETFPIAGTRKVTGDKNADARRADDLLKDEKELAEHTMLVDMGRNDIGKVCRFGTVRPESLMTIKRFSHVQHIVTHLKGQMENGQDMFSAFESVFPAGTVSGAPKIRAMEIIDGLESHPRGPYAGAVGYFSYNGCCDFAIAIRSIFIDKGVGFVQSGAGIVYDSVPKNEFAETEHKALAMLQAIKEASQ